jgi:hypothetical protein|tara:strand:+ start:318 stop:785 length:468 start_codon:yes stop_codon:yes gene_type:complete
MIELFGNIWRLEYPSLIVFDGSLEQAYASLSLPDRMSRCREGWTEVEDISDMKIHEVLLLNKYLSETYDLVIDMNKLHRSGISLFHPPTHLFKTDQITHGLPKLSEKEAMGFNKMYCTCCGEGHEPRDIGIVYGSHHCVGCADEMGEPLQNRGVH